MPTNKTNKHPHQCQQVVTHLEVISLQHLGIPETSEEAQTCANRLHILNWATHINCSCIQAFLGVEHALKPLQISAAKAAVYDQNHYTLYITENKDEILTLSSQRDKYTLT